MPSITSANAVFMLAINSVFAIPQQLQGFATDDIFSTEPIDSVETVMGVDGELSGGFVFVPVKQTISLQASSPSNDLFDAWWTAQQAIQDTLSASGIVTLSGLSRKWILTNGFLTSYQPMPDAGKLLKPRKFGITWNQVVPVPA